MYVIPVRHVQVIRRLVERAAYVLCDVAGPDEVCRYNRCGIVPPLHIEAKLFGVFSSQPQPAIPEIFRTLQLGCESGINHLRQVDIVGIFTLVARSLELDGVGTVASARRRPREVATSKQRPCP